MNIQLEFLTPYYYSTLGYDCDLIDYLNFIDDSFIRNLFPEYQQHFHGRKPHDPVTLYRMHYLYFTKPEFITFRQMCKELKKPKHQDYRNFIGAFSIDDVPSHAALSRFRNALGITEQQVEEIKAGSKAITDFTSLIDIINREFVQQSVQEDGFLNINLGSIDSRPIKSNVGNFKNECTCGTPDKCKCPPRFSDPDAGVGRQRLKVNQNKYFIGYRKNTVIVGSSEGPVPVTSVLVNAKTSDQNITIPAVEQIEKMGINIPTIVGDMGYMNDDTKIKAAKDHKTIFHTEVKKNMVPPEYCNENGILECPEGNKMNVLDFDTNKLEIIAGVGDHNICQDCWRYGVCQGEFILSMKEQPHYYNMIPQGSDIQEALKNFRKQSELNFAIEANQLASKCRYNKVPIRNLSKVDVFMRLADISLLTKKLIAHCQKKYYGEEYFLQRAIAFEKFIYQREYHVMAA